MTRMLIERWWTKWSVWVLTVAVAIAELSPYVPELQAILPPDWYRAALGIALLARVLKQRVGGTTPI